MSLGKSATRLMAPPLISALVIFELILLSLLTLRYYSVDPSLAWLDYDHDAESRAEVTRIPQIVSYDAPPTDVHTFLDDGEVVVGIKAPKHPVFDILEFANTEWQFLVNAHGGDERAMLQYRYRHTGSNRPAPDLTNINLPIYSPLHLFTSIPSSLLESRQRETEILPDTFSLVLHSGVPHIIYGNLSQSSSQEYRAERVEQLLTAIKPFAQTLSDLHATFNLLPHPRHPIPFEAVDTLAALAADQPLPHSSFKFLSQAEPAGPSAPRGRHVHEKDLALLEKIMTRPKHWSWDGGCRTKPDIVDPEDEDQKSDLSLPIRFVGFPKARSDPCVHLALRELHPFFQTSASNSYTRLSPIVSDTTAPWASDILIPPLELFSSQHAENNVRAIPWDNKTSGLFWRGALSAEQTHPAVRLQHFFNVTARGSEQSLILPEKDNGMSVDRRWLNDIFTYDIRPGPHEDAREQESSWKFLVDLGEGVRMRERMASGGLVFRPLLLGDWFSERSVPWVHYVPVQPDLSDLPSLVAFFERHDELARSIADAGQAWARQQLGRDRAQESVRELLEGFATLSSQG